MSSSWGNIISIVDEPFDMFGKLMSVRDELIVKYFTLCTDISLEEIAAIEQELKDGTNPRDIKMRLATEVVTMYHSEKDAALAKNSWIETFSKGGVPESILEIKVSEGVEIVDELIKSEVVASKSEWRRLVEEGAVTDTEGNTVSDPKEKVSNRTLKIGKKRFAKIIIS
jgi:tyrosyl-tRNA synthetase